MNSSFNRHTMHRITHLFISEAYFSIALPALSSREKEVLELIAEGYTNPQIAEKIFLSPFTVDSHRKNLLAKLAVKNTASLIRLAVEKKLI